SRRRHTRSKRDWSSDVCSSDLEMIEFRDSYTRQIGARLIVHTNEEAIAEGAQPFILGTARCCGLLKTKSLLDALEAGGYDAAFRSEERRVGKEGRARRGADGEK